MEAERGDVGERAGSGAGEAGAVRLGGVLDDEQAVALGELTDPVHVADLAEQVDGDDRGRSLAHELRCRRGVDQPGVGADVAQHRGRARVQNAQRSRDRRVGRQDDLIPGADAGRDQPEAERRGPGGDADGVPRPAEPCEFALEGLHLGGESGVAVRQDAVHHGAQLLGKLRVLATQVDERHLPRARRILLGLGEQVYLRDVAASFTKAELRWLLTAVVAR